MTRIVNVSVTKVYDWLEKTKERINILRGGTRSSKSYSLAQHIIFNKLITGDNRVIVIARKTLPALRKTAMKLMLDLLEEYQIPVRFNKTELELRYKNNLVYFMSLDDPGKIASIDYNDCWLEEAVDFTLEDFRQFNLRASRKGEGNQLFLTFNPVSSLHWIKTKLLDKRTSGIAENVSTYKDNIKNLSPEIVAEIEDLINQDDNFYHIYTLGQWGTLTETIYHFPTVDEPEGFDDITFGIDFGYNNPSTVVKVYWIDGRAVWQEVYYKSNLTNTELINEIKQAVSETDLNYNWYADSAEPARIEEFYRAGFNIYPADKSVKDGIDFCKTHVIGITKDSTNAIKERQSYSYKKDKDGNVLEEPVKFADHCMDAGRYGTYKAGLEAVPNIIIIGER
jgi:phage terminase large subunit